MSLFENISGAAKILRSLLQDATTSAKGSIKLATDLGGTADAPTVVQLTGSGGLVPVPTAALTFGSNPPTTGIIRLTEGESIVYKYSAGPLDLPIAQGDSGANIIFGGPLTSQMTLGPGGAVDWYIYNTNYFRIRQTGLFLFSTGDPTATAGGSGIFSTSGELYHLSPNNVKTAMAPLGANTGTAKAFQWVEGTCTSSGAVASDMTTFTIPNGASVSGFVQALGRDDATGDTVAFGGFYGAKDVSGTPTILGTGVIPQTSSDAALAAATVTATISSSAIILRVSGVAGKNMHWMGSNRPMIYV